MHNILVNGSYLSEHILLFLCVVLRKNIKLTTFNESTGFCCIYTMRKNSHSNWSFNSKFLLEPVNQEKWLSLFLFVNISFSFPPVYRLIVSNHWIQQNIYLALKDYQCGFTPNFTRTRAPPTHKNNKGELNTREL